MNSNEEYNLYNEGPPCKTIFEYDENRYAHVRGYVRENGWALMFRNEENKSGYYYERAKYIMMCPKCDNIKTYIIDSAEQDYSTRRRRQCPHCGYKFTTFERLAQSAILKDRNKTDDR